MSWGPWMIWEGGPLTKRAAEWVVIAVFLEEIGGNWPTDPYLIEDGDGDWAFFLFPNDMTSYITTNGVHWNGTIWDPGLAIECGPCGKLFELPLPRIGTTCGDPWCKKTEAEDRAITRDNGEGS